MACSKPAKVNSEIPNETLEFTWNVAKFAMIRTSKKLLDLTSVQFEMGSSIGMPVTLKVCLEQVEGKEKEVKGKEEKGVKGEEEQDMKKYVAIWLKLVAAPPDAEVIVVFQCRVGEFFRGLNNVTNEFKDNSKRWGWHRFMLQDVDIAKLPLDSNGALPIIVKVTLFNTKGTSQTTIPLPPTPPQFPPAPLTLTNLMAKWEEPFLKKLLQDKDNLRKNQRGLPQCVEMVVLTSKKGEEVRVSGLMLAERSSVFQQMLQMPLKSPELSGDRVVKMEEMGMEALDVFLTFLQTATLEEDKWNKPGILEELAAATYKYQIQDLLNFLEEALELVCTPKNCTNLIVLAKKLGLRKAEKALLKKYQEEWKEAVDLEKMRELFEGAAVAACPKQHVQVKDSSKKKEKLKNFVSWLL